MAAADAALTALPLVFLLAAFLAFGAAFLGFLATFFVAVFLPLTTPWNLRVGESSRRKQDYHKKVRIF